MKQGKEAKPNLATEANIAAGNRLIARFEEYIKRLNAPGTAARTLVAALYNLNNALGDSTLLNGRTMKGSEKLFEILEFKVKVPAPMDLPQELLPDYKAK